jgi:hypothetical protein
MSKKRIAAQARGEIAKGFHGKLMGLFTHPFALELRTIESTISSWVGMECGRLLSAPGMSNPRAPAEHRTRGDSLP